MQPEELMPYRFADSIQGFRLDAIPCRARITYHLCEMDSIHGKAVMPYRFADAILRKAQIPYSLRLI